ncbi:MAG: tRNA/rRNA methyltransferase [Alkalispirochaeta sp.]
MREWSIVLVEPARGGNIGAAARAMKTMGFTDLRIVDPEGTAPVTDEEAIAFAHGSTEILAAAQRFPSLDEALADCGTAIATTGRRRGKRDDLYTPEELVRVISEGPPVERIALVFGPEDRGLSNEELDQCDIVTAVPMRSPYPSLNLGQAVMVYTYALSPLLFETKRRIEHVPPEGSVRAMREKAREILPRLGFDPGRAIVTRILERITAASAGDVRLIHSVLNAIELHLPDTVTPSRREIPTGEDRLPRSRPNRSEQERRG